MGCPGGWAFFGLQSSAWQEAETSQRPVTATHRLLVSPCCVPSTVLNLVAGLGGGVSTATTELHVRSAHLLLSGVRGQGTPGRPSPGFCFPQKSQPVWPGCTLHTHPMEPVPGPVGGSVLSGSGLSRSYAAID